MIDATELLTPLIVRRSFRAIHTGSVNNLFSRDMHLEQWEAGNDDATAAELIADAAGLPAAPFVEVALGAAIAGPPLHPGRAAAVGLGPRPAGSSTHAFLQRPQTRPTPRRRRDG